MLKRAIKLAGGLLSGWLASMVWALLFTTFLGFSGDYPIVGVLIAIIVIMGYLVIIYSTAWRQGFRDRNMVNTGHLENVPLLGLYAGLLASAPSLLIAIWYFIARYLVTDAFFITNIAVRIWNLVFLQIIAATVETWPYILFLVLLPMPLAAQLGYSLGMRDISIAAKVIYVNKDNQNKKKK